METLNFFLIPVIIGFIAFNIYVICRFLNMCNDIAQIKKTLTNKK